MIADRELDEYEASATKAINNAQTTATARDIAKLILALVLEVKAARGEIRRMKAVVREAQKATPAQVQHEVEPKKDPPVEKPKRTRKAKTTDTESKPKKTARKVGQRQALEATK